jgi:hypothetical protein
MMVTNLFGDRWSPYATGAMFWVFWGVADRMLADLQDGKKVAATRPQVIDGAAAHAQ